MGRRTPQSRSIISPEQVLTAYEHGLFPMAEGQSGSVKWYVAEPRAVIPLDERFKIRRSLRQIERKGGYRIAINTAFEAVIRSCAGHGKVSLREVWLGE